MDGEDGWNKVVKNVNGCGMKEGREKIRRIRGRK